MTRLHFTRSALLLATLAAIGCGSTSPDDLASARAPGEELASRPAESLRDEASATCSNPTAPRPPADPGDRVVVYATTGGDQYGTRFPSPSKSWTLKYTFVVPPVPCSSTWNPNNATFYIWGDVDFDVYGSNGAFPLSDYLYNQIVPQLMIGDTLNEDPKNPYQGTGVVFTNWVVEAQYFWMNANGTYNVQAGRAIPVHPGDVTTTTIAYHPTTGSITASISTPTGGTSTITIPRPFPNVSPAPFTSWKDFFTKGAAKSGGVLHGTPSMNVESHYVDQATICGALPWTIDGISIPNIASVPSNFGWDTRGSFTCAGTNSLVNFDF